MNLSKPSLHHLVSLCAVTCLTFVLSACGHSARASSGPAMSAPDQTNTRSACRELSAPLLRLSRAGQQLAGGVADVGRTRVALASALPQIAQHSQSASSQPFSADLAELVVAMRGMLAGLHGSGDIHAASLKLLASTTHVRGLCAALGD